MENFCTEYLRSIFLTLEVQRENSPILHRSPMKHIVNGQSGGEKLKYVLKGEGKRFLHGDVDVHCMNIQGGPNYVTPLYIFACDT